MTENTKTKTDYTELNLKDDKVPLPAGHFREPGRDGAPHKILLIAK